MIEDGSFDEIFNKYNLEAIKKANLKNRKLIKIENPMLSPKLNLNNEKLWFKP